MKKYFISIIFALSALVMLNGCIVSDKKLSEKVQQAIVDDEQTKGNTLEVTDFNLEVVLEARQRVLQIFHPCPGIHIAALQLQVGIRIGLEVFILLRPNLLIILRNQHVALHTARECHLRPCGTKEVRKNNE